MNQYPPQGGQKQQQHDDTANLDSQIINEEISVTMRKRLEIEAISYRPDETQSSQLSLHLISKYNTINITCHQKSQGQFLTK